MKKTLLGLLMLLFFTTAKSQTYLRTEGAVAGTKNEYTEEIAWGEKNMVSILIKVEDSKVTIYSKREQTFRKIGIVDREDKMLTWRCTDHNGTICNVSFMFLDDRPEYICVIVEYKDIVIMYVAKKE
jgi:hypothetical protein